MQDCRAIYSSCKKCLQIKVIELDGRQSSSLNFRFIGVNNPQVLAGVKASTPDLANVTPDVIGLNSLLTTIMSGSASYSSLRQVAASCVVEFTNQNVNTELIELCQEEGDDSTALNYLYTLLIDRFIPLCL